MVNLKKLVAMAKKWQNLASLGHKRITLQEPLALMTQQLLLLEMAEEEYGLQRDGPIRLPLKAAFMRYTISHIERQISKELEEELRITITSWKCLSTSNMQFEQVQTQLFWDAAQTPLGALPPRLLPADMAVGPQQGTLPLDPARGCGHLDPRIFVPATPHKESQHEKHQETSENGKEVAESGSTRQKRITFPRATNRTTTGIDKGQCGGHLPHMNIWTIAYDFLLSKVV
ncbi:auxin responsive SAUR protein [Tanacetum coccineum]